MRRSMTTLLLAALVATSSVFAVVAEPLSAQLELATEISAINEMKLTADPFETPTRQAFIDAAENGSTETVSPDTDEDVLAYLSVLTNNRKGFTVEIGATPLASANKDNGYRIGYVLTCGEASLEANTTGAKVSITSGEIEKLSAFTYGIMVDVDDDQYNAALEDEYTATVSFSYTAD